ncbi:MAG: family 78 glycoside hydrolase catalytic domain [Kiritimatiellae bacterium]|nr:family 78 glycoside hydrolase catalytic domain [Kiritimatiellia bacterium]
MMRQSVCLLSSLLASILAVFSVGCLSDLQRGAQLKAPCQLQVENLLDATGIDVAQPRLSWKLAAAESRLRDLRQHSYQIVVSDSLTRLKQDDGNLWDSGRVVSEQQLEVIYAGAPLKSSQYCYWKVRAWSSADSMPSRWSAPSRWVTGIMRPQDWKAQWIGANASTRPDYDLKGAQWIWHGFTEKLEQAPAGNSFYYALFDAPQDVSTRSMILTLTADDDYEVYLNGQLAVKTWGHLNVWKWMRFIDVTALLRPGQNQIAARVHNKEKGPTGLLAVLRDDKTTLLRTDASWKAVSANGKEWFKPLSSLEQPGMRAVVVAGGVGARPWGEIERRFEIASPAFEKSFTLPKDVTQATLHISGLGFYEASLNGVKIGAKVLDPVPTKYDQRVLYSTYDLSQSLKRGKNNLQVLLGHGWYDMRSVSVWNFDNAPWRDFPRMIAQLEVIHTDGSISYVLSDQSWRQVASPLGYDCIRQGVVVGKSHPAAPDFEVQTIMAEIVPAPKGKLCASALPPSVITQTLLPQSVRQLGEHHWVVDFGQNTAGWVNLKLLGQQRGDYVTLRYGERLKPDGSLDNKSIKAHFRHPASAPLVKDGDFQKDHVFCSGDPDESFNPCFVYHGFQYVEITGLRRKPDSNSIVAAVIHTDFKSAGSFECSNELLNKLQQATLWAYKGNYVNGYPTDCPQREKNGWTGDASLASELGMYNFDNTAAYEKWVRDLTDEQQPDGNLAAIIPTSGWGYQWGNGPAWDSALLIVPWMLYVYKGDTQVLEQNYQAMRSYVDYTSSRAKDDLVSHGLGDWIPAKSKVPAEVTSSAYYYLDCMILARTAELLKNAADAEKYAALAQRVKKAFNQKFYQGEGVYSIGTQTALACALHQGIAADSHVEATRKALVELVALEDCVPDFGILGSKYLFRALSDAGATELAYRMLNKTERPSFGKWIVHDGATTLWEDWDEGASRNHIMFGDFSAWMYQYLAGIRLSDDVSTIASKVDPLKVAFKEFVIAPEPVPGLTYVNAKHNSPYGEIRSDWVITADGAFHLEVDVPVNTTAIVYLPTKPGAKVNSSPIVSEFQSGSGGAAFKVGSGRYAFDVPGFQK